MNFTVDQLASHTLNAAFKVHQQLGPGLLESVYETCLAHELESMNLQVQRQVPLPVVYNDIRLDGGYRVDLLLENSLVIEIKSVESLNDLHVAQVLTYLKLCNFRLGLLLNFNTYKLKDGIRRLIMGYDT